MNEYRVIFHFDNENTRTLFFKGESEEQVLNDIYSRGNFCDGEYQKGFIRINLKLVKYVSVYKKK